MHSLVIENDVPIALRDGAVIYANVFRPAGNARVPVIITLGPYPKDVPFREWNPAAWDRLEVRASDDPHHTFTHTDPRDRIQRGSVTIHGGGSFDSHLLVPIIPVCGSGHGAGEPDRTGLARLSGVSR